MNERNISRRKFIATTAITASGITALGLPAFASAGPGLKSIRVGLIGAGSRGCGLAGLIKELPSIELVACCDILPAHLQDGMKIAGKGAKAYTDYRKLLEDKNVDVVIIATPLYLHFPMAADALDAGKHVYLEKSMTYDIPQTLQLVKKVKESKLVFQVGYQYRYYGLYQKIKEVMASNWLGKVTHFECQYNRNSNWRNPVSDPKLERQINWRMYREYCGGPLSELCAHEIDMVNYLTDSHPLKVVGMGSVNYWKDGRDTYDNVRTIYEYPNGVKASFTSVLSNAFNGYNIRILGDKATVDIQREKAFIYAESTENKRGIVDGVTGATIEAITQGKPVEIAFAKPGEEIVEPTTYALQDFFDCIRNNKKTVSNVVTAAETSIAIHMGNAAMDTGSLQEWKPGYAI
ncbi:Gfo/Idh/MocA family protein [Flavihumibacter profundi]|uniref:Gfo/Idh/MocA family protein n=1 Tax=Flavihumibacter profundi TaxID=2716883 RepID=UPI001CC4C69F|nr:Gfo/Idh/MocA family oxidoreductase [Flavihumibacter profundi]MBZ5858256.1 Gfo/Idh/MocA family oxidoreductase [Flavihumibacter profundi]